MRSPSPIRVAARWIWAARLDALKPNDVLTVYHSTQLVQLPKLLNGFDANQPMKRHFNVRTRHRGLFVTPDINLGGSFGNVTLEMQVRAKNLHGTTWGGDIGKSWNTSEESEMLRAKFPNSFRPGLSESMLKRGEPQGLLRGLVRPGQIKRVRYEGKWYSRKEFLALETPSKAKDVGYDLSYPGYSLEEFFEALAAFGGKNLKNDALRLWKANPENAREALSKTMGNRGFGQTAIEAFFKKMEQEVRVAALVARLHRGA